MRCEEINIRDPFVLNENGTYYMYGTRAKNFGRNVGGFDVYVSDDLTNWSAPHLCFDAAAFGMDKGEQWAPEVHKYQNAYYLFATFRQKDGLRGTYVLKADHPLGPFHPHSDGAVTPKGWECLDGTLYIENEKPFLVFCHEHTQIIDGTICYVQLSEDLSEAVSEPVTLFSASSTGCSDRLEENGHFVTDGPFLFRTKDHVLLMIWSTFIKEQYAECVVRFSDGLQSDFTHLKPLIDNDGGHGMLFYADDTLYFTFHSPNTKGHEHPKFLKISDLGDALAILS